MLVHSKIKDGFYSLFSKINILLKLTFFILLTSSIYMNLYIGFLSFFTFKNSERIREKKYWNGKGHKYPMQT